MISALEALKNIEAGLYDEILKPLYVEESRIASERERYKKAVNGFITLYGDKDIEIYSAPGRTEVGGNHTDHQHGRVLASSVNIDMIAVVSKRGDTTVNLKSEGFSALKIDLSDLRVKPEEKESTASLIRGMAYFVAESGYVYGGFDAFVTSEVLSGSGLSSSAAFEVLTGNVFSGLFNESRISAEKIAILSQKAENVYFGKPCGLMDQMASSIGGLITIDFKDPSKPVTEKVEVDFEKYGYSLCILDTKGSHADLTDDYAAVPAEMKSVAKYLGAEVLRDVSEEEFYGKLPEIRKELGDRAVLRALHFFNENERVGKQVNALNNGDFDRFLQLIKESGDSSYKYLQNVFSTHKLNEQSVSVALCLSEEILKENGVSRVHGGGFAGTVQSFVKNETVPEYKEKIEKVFGAGACHVLKIRPVGGCRVL